MIENDLMSWLGRQENPRAAEPPKVTLVCVRCGCNNEVSAVHCFKCGSKSLKMKR